MLKLGIGYMKSPKEGKKSTCSIHFQPAKLSGVLYHDRFLMFIIFRLVKNLLKGSSSSIWSFVEQVQIMLLSVISFKTLDECFQSVWKTSEHLWMVISLYGPRSGARFL